VVFLHVEFYSYCVARQAKHERVFKELGARLKTMRQKSGHSQEDMLSFGFSTRHWQQIEAGRPITLTTLLRVCDAFQVAPERLLHGLWVAPAQTPQQDPRR
jgi:transcriptional regulator with XRE-family HTH domain